MMGLVLNRNKICVLLLCLAGKKEEDDKLFENIIGYDNVKRLFRMALAFLEIIATADYPIRDVKICKKQ
jgi:hypothetical protein